ncbi:ferredoxin reductase [Nocardioides sp. LHG3406-4]|uniref:ferredoxin reductase n=1 Tax=Nocardioides sp. LHG3406-4 TaxID=2804575 RepID=UPI003CEEC17E
MTTREPSAAEVGDAPPGTPRREPIRWLRARLEDSWLETRTARTLVFSVPEWPGHLAGQHVDIKLTAEDGYAAQRSYSIASAAQGDRLELTVQAVSRGEVSPYLVDIMQPGDELELRGPIGGWFTWTEHLTEPVLLVGGGSGIVPLMAMLRQRVLVDSSAPFRVLYSARTPDHLFYANELYDISQKAHGITVDRIYTRSGLPDDTREPGRLRPEDLPEAAASSRSATGVTTRVYVCGPTSFVESAAQLLLDRGHPASTIRTERFGPSGG